MLSLPFYFFPQVLTLRNLIKLLLVYFHNRFLVFLTCCSLALSLVLAGIGRDVRHTLVT